MKVLIVKKTTNLELHGSRIKLKVSKGQFSQRDLEYLQSSHDEHYESLRLLKDQLEKHEIIYDEVSRGTPWRGVTDYDYVFTVGGDGTCLYASHYVEDDTKIIAIRSSGASVGALCSCHGSEVEKVVDFLLDRKLEYQKINRIKAIVSHLDFENELETVPVLNDFLFANSNPAATTLYGVSFKGQFEVQKSSGIWVSTALGSTAAIYAAGGQDLQRSDPRVQFRVRELYQPKGSVPFKIFGGLIDNPEDFWIENQSERAILALDGQHGMINLSFGDVIRFKRAKPLNIACRFT